MNPKIIAFCIALMNLVGCVPPGFYAAPQTSVNVPAYTAGPNVGGQPGNTIPIGATVVTRNGYAYRRGLPVANMYGASGPMAAQLRADGEALAQQDYAAAAAAAPQAPSTGTTTNGGSSTSGGGSVTERLDSVAQQQVQMHNRINCLEHPHAPNCH